MAISLSTSYHSVNCVVLVILQYYTLSVYTRAELLLLLSRSTLYVVRVWYTNYVKLCTIPPPGTWIALEESGTVYEMTEISLYGAGGDPEKKVVEIYVIESTAPQRHNRQDVNYGITVKVASGGTRFILYLVYRSNSTDKSIKFALDS